MCIFVTVLKCTRVTLGITGITTGFEIDVLYCNVNHV